MIRLLVETRPQPGFPLNRAELVPLMEAILEVIGFPGADMTLRLVGDAEIARLNAAHLGCSGPTNVLSFPARDPGEAGPEVFDEDLLSCCEDLPEDLEYFDPEDYGEEDAEPDGDEEWEDDEQGPALGEIALSVDTLAREVRLYGQDPREHQIRLLAHAALHLAGMDHGPEMEAMTEAVLDALL